MAVAAATTIAALVTGAAEARADKRWQPVQVITGLRQAGLPIGAVFYFWPPGQFNRKANFRDRRLRGRTFGVDNGGSVETFANKRAASIRYRYVHGTSIRSSRFGTYNYIESTVVLRLSHRLTPVQAKAYERAFRRVF
jgi:hypothetical protein